MGCLWNPKSCALEHKYGRNPWKMSKIGQNSMKKWPFFAIILPWMARYGSETSFLLIFSARDDLVKVSWKSDVGKCQNQLTPPYFDQLNERHQLLYSEIFQIFHDLAINCKRITWLGATFSHPDIAHCNYRQKYMKNWEQNTNTKQRNANTKYDRFEGIWSLIMYRFRMLIS